MKWAWALVAMSWLVACSGQSPDDLQSCLLGWWQDTGTACSSYCPGSEACADPDCRARATIGLLPSGRSVRVIVLVGASPRSFSSTTPPLVDRWEVDASQQQKLTQAGPGQPVTCSTTQLGFQTAGYTGPRGRWRWGCRRHWTPGHGRITRIDRVGRGRGNSLRHRPVVTVQGDGRRSGPRIRAISFRTRPSRVESASMLYGRRDRPARPARPAHRRT